jgi:hypothetical protein
LTVTERRLKSYRLQLNVDETQNDHHGLLLLNQLRGADHGEFALRGADRRQGVWLSSVVNQLRGNVGPPRVRILDG